jgi:hypothetical protein
MGYSVGRGKHNEDGMWCVVDAESMEVVTKGQEEKEWISDIKYSPDGKQLAIGSHDNKIYLYDATKGYAYKGIKCEAHNSYIAHFDYASDGKYLRSTCGVYELLFHSASNVARAAHPSSRTQSSAARRAHLGGACRGSGRRLPTALISTRCASQQTASLSQPRMTSVRSRSRCTTVLA